MHTLERALTDPHIFSGIGNAYLQQVVQHRESSPMTLTSSLSDTEIARLHKGDTPDARALDYRAARSTGDGFPVG